MSTASFFFHPLDHAQGRTEKPFKHTFFQSHRLLIGLNTLLPGQEQHRHEHADQDKCYIVLAGSGAFQVGDTVQTCTTGDLILAPAGVPHGVVNTGTEMLTFLTIIAPYS